MRRLGAWRTLGGCDVSLVAFFRVVSLLDESGLVFSKVGLNEPGLFAFSFRWCKMLCSLLTMRVTPHRH